MLARARYETIEHGFIHWLREVVHLLTLCFLTIGWLVLDDHVLVTSGDP